MENKIKKVKENCISVNANTYSQTNDMSVEDYKPLQPKGGKK